jgi:hypothetical protein
MTHRTEMNQPTPIENATRGILLDLSDMLHEHYSMSGVGAIQHIPEDEFRRIIALYFYNKSISDWCQDLHVQDATDPTERKPSQ